MHVARHGKRDHDANGFAATGLVNRDHTSAWEKWTKVAYFTKWPR
jgi:hypothetical protein